jgi:hypothetical protein
VDKKIESLKNTRKNLLHFISELTIEQLNEIPKGYNNNIIWNLAHLLSAQQSICYTRAGLKPTIDEALFLNYKPGTKPQAFVTGDEVDLIKELCLTAIDQFKRDCQNNLFSNYTTWTNHYGMEITSIGDALTFVYFHEGLHLGYIMAMKKRVIQNEKPY